MTSQRALLPSAAAGIVAAAVTFAVVTAIDGDEEREGAGEPAAAPATAAPTAPAEGRELFASMGCGGCHRLADAHSTGTIGPDLDERLVGHDRASLARVILYPAGSAAGGFSVMPDNFGERMTERELDTLVGYLLAAARP